MRAVVLNCTLKPSPQPSNTEQLARVVVEALEGHGVEVSTIRLADHDIPPGVESDLGGTDEWPAVRRAVLDAEILVVATPTWVGHPSSIAQKMLERMDAMISETDDAGRPVAYNRVAGVVVTGNEDGAHHVISEIAGALVDIGFTVAPQGWTYWNRGPGPGPDYSGTDEGHEWSRSTGRAMAQNLVGVARALAATPLGPPAS
ncbi:flavodoxin family protein [Cellulomonas sp. PS-H5]|uniref:flavodoxin family protein n=1 Tax=Cellulomonas sp. PS-H5 TaxID=2820400 RepID=UPI001C4F90FC|nr:flavodoxin family protein [Cellulomonas sp. PS-H5]MBW0254539.1 flavodoxin family protein [Cellulomonas sp. PS-H5]